MARHRQPEAAWLKPGALHKLNKVRIRRKPIRTFCKNANKRLNMQKGWIESAAMLKY
ncbi:hypothetical protein [Paenibacillus sp. JJ-223]|uniref:hypothetical protein n=1 Tax=Paenibacillus sp. JJ-223 TaxID=2905647 RepID=UPI001F371175|nr:hypothetical protein [Paenibacillus sp. JJ-223]